MIYKEEIRDLFSIPDDYYLAHCISADFGMGKGIVVEFNKRFDMKRKLQNNYPGYLEQWYMHSDKGDCLLENRVFNLITKKRYYEKPTYTTMRNALERMKELCELYDIKKIAMPIIGCGLDRLKWDEVSKIIQEIFSDTDIEILICKQ